MCTVAIKRTINGLEKRDGKISIFNIHYFLIALSKCLAIFCVSWSEKDDSKYFT